MVSAVPKTVVTMRLNGACASHSRTDLTVRDLRTTIDEPVDRGGTNQGLTPTETLLASLLACTNVITKSGTCARLSECCGPFTLPWH